jgi:hypothetical protein
MDPDRQTHGPQPRGTPGLAPVLSCVFGVSFASLAYEIALARIFSIGQWNHLSFMVISIALFGFAVGGSFLTLRPILTGRLADAPSPQRAAPLLALLTAAAILASFAGVNHLPLDYFRLLVEPAQLGYLLAAYLVLALPFGLAGTVVAAAYVDHPVHSGGIYFVSMAGSGIGAATLPILLPSAGETGVVAAAAVAPAAAAAFALFLRPGRLQRQDRWVLALACLVGAGAIALLLGPTDGIRISEYKQISQLAQLPGTFVSERHRSIRGRVERVESPHLRFAPGLSLKHTDPLPAVQAVLTDGDRPFFLYDVRGGLAFATATLSYSGHTLVDPAGNVLVIAPGGGGLSIACALASGARSVRVVHPDEHVAAIIRSHYGIDVAADSPRSFLARNRDTFDLIHLDAWGASIPGADALNQDHLLTVEGLAACLGRLRRDGVLVISRRLLLPPSDCLRLWATAHRALAFSGVAAPQDSIAILRNFDTYTLLVARGPIRATALLDFARRHNFDLMYLNGGDETLWNRFNVFDQPFHARELQQLADAFSAGRPGDYFDRYLVDVAPLGDVHPFPGQFLKFTHLPERFRALGSRVHAFLLSGEVIIGAVLIEAFLLALLFVVVPAWLAARSKRSLSPSAAGYFVATGAGFMFAELFFMHAGTFLLGDPVLSLTITTVALLVASGWGGLYTERHGRHGRRGCLVACGAALAVSAGALWASAEPILALPEPARWAVLALAAAVPGFFMGIPFPLGMRRERTAGAPARALAWALSGGASVVAAVASTQIAVALGLAWLLAAALFAYAVALFAASPSDPAPG